MQADFPNYPSAKPAMYALEMPKNWFTLHKIKTGREIFFRKRFQEKVKQAYPESSRSPIHGGLMGKIFASLIVLCFGSLSLAIATPAYDLKMDLLVKGNHSAPHVVTKAGEKAKIIQDGNDGKTFLDVIATEDQLTDEGHHLISMKFEIGTIDKQGKRTVLAQPQITSFEGEEATISVGNEDGTQDMTLKVIASPTTITL